MTTETTLKTMTIDFCGERFYLVAVEGGMSRPATEEEIAIIRAQLKIEETGEES